MNPNDYNFKIGDLVITTFGETGYIEDICECDECAKRGFYEPTWVDEYGDNHYITVYNASRGFDDFYQIGEYRFNRLFNKIAITTLIDDYESRLSKLKKQLDVIEGVEKGMVE